MASKRPRARARSNPDPVFLRSAGDRFTTMRLGGRFTPVSLRALLTRAPASETAASGSPTTVSPGKPLEITTSTPTRWASIPINVDENVRLRIYRFTGSQTGRPLYTKLTFSARGCQPPRGLEPRCQIIRTAATASTPRPAQYQRCRLPSPRLAISPRTRPDTAPPI